MGSRVLRRQSYAALFAGITSLTAMSTIDVRAADADGLNSVAEISALSIEELGNIQVSSVSKTAQPLSTAPAAIYVITQDDIARSGATRIPEMLRLAPNLDVAAAGSSAYAISARGFNGTLANKLLVLIDGRSVYTPLYGGVYWDMQDVMPEDIDRIEVISGPGATLWGANAVNGVINITTKKSSDTQGGILTLGAGNLERSASLQYGGSLSDDASYRVYAKGYEHQSTITAAGKNSHDGWRVPQGGFRFDWSPENDLITVQGDIYRASEDQPAASDQIESGHNLTTRWEHHFASGSVVQIQAYYDRAQRFDNNGGFALDTYDVDVQHSFKFGTWNDIVWGGGYRVNHDQIRNAVAFQIQPDTRTLSLGNAFVQDSIALAKSLKLTVGLKLEDEEFTGLEALPSARVSWQVNDKALIWSAVSRAVRAPTRFDRDVVEKLGPIVFLMGGADFQPETLMAYELGTRVEASSRLSFSISTFYNVYDSLRSIEANPVTHFLPLVWGNLMAGKVYGMEAWASYQINNWWRVSGGFNVQHENLGFKPGSSGLGGIQQAGNDPDHQISLRSSMKITDDILFDADVRYVSALPNPVVPAYVELNGRLGWKPTKYMEISISGNNLLHRYYREFNGGPTAVEMARSVFVETRWSF
ncbi:MAG: TonB-dependent receptor [Rhodospirillaceae bacterium]|nr:MAG: TonB-dependent receptor [Rhodospirillaceae bacterium]